MSESTKIAFLFPGQGAQDVGMGTAACAKSPAAKALFDRATSVLGFDLYKLCAEGPKSELDSTVNSQPALFVSSLAALEVLKQEQPAIVDQCAATAGLSLGEYTALVFAGVMDFEAGLRVVQERGRAMQAAADATSSGMLSVLGMEREQVEKLVAEARSDQVLEVANLLCPGNIVCSGEAAACERLITLATEAGAMKVIPLAVAGAFHTSLMQPAVERLRKALADVPMKKPQIRVVSNVDARAHEDPNEIRELLIKQVCSQVRWEDSMRYLLDSVGISQFYEIGAGRVLAGLLKRIARKTPVENISA